MKVAKKIRVDFGGSKRADELIERQLSKFVERIGRGSRVVVAPYGICGVVFDRIDNVCLLHRDDGNEPLIARVSDLSPR